GSTSSKDGRPTKYNSSYGHQLEASPGVRFCLAQMRNVNDCGHAGSKSGEQINKQQFPRDRNSSVTCSLCGMADGVKTPPVSSPMEPPPEAGNCSKQDQ